MWPTAAIRVRSTQYPSNTPPKSSTTRSPLSSRRSVGRACGNALFGPGRDDRLERRPLESGAVERRFDRARDLAFGAASGDHRPQIRRDGREPQCPIPYRPKLDVVLDHALGLDQGLRRLPVDGRHPTLPLLEPADRDGRRLEAGAPRAQRRHHRRERLVVAAFDDVERDGSQGAGRQRRANGVDVAPIGEQARLALTDEQPARRSRESGEIANVDGVRHHEGVDLAIGCGLEQALAAPRPIRARRVSHAYPARYSDTDDDFRVSTRFRKRLSALITDARASARRSRPAAAAGARGSSGMTGGQGPGPSSASARAASTAAGST